MKTDHVTLNSKNAHDPSLENDASETFASSLDLAKSLSFCVFDLETTGGNHQNDKIIEIGLVKIENLIIVDQKNYLINPEIPIPEFIQRLTSIKPKSIVNSPTIEMVIDEVLIFMGDAILVAHNASFDVPFFNSVLQRLNKPKLTNRSICTNLMTKYLIPEIMNSNLNYMSRIFDIEHQKAHRALEDARATAELLLTFINFFIEKNIKKINQLYYPRNKYELDRIHFKNGPESLDIFNKLKDTETPLLLTLKGEKGILLTVIPVENFKNEFTAIKKLLEQFDYQTMTARMVGTFFEAFLKFNSQASKLKNEQLNLVMEFLFSMHLKVKGPIPTVLAPEQMVLGKKDFMIVPHLIPEQYIVYPISNLQNKNELIIRYPGHKKKFQQFILNQSKRMAAIKGYYSSSNIHKNLFVFFNMFLQHLMAENDSKHLLMSKDLIKKKPQVFQELTDEFFLKNKKTYNYPKKHI
jgi:DNA polymerase-3 subunit epsilon